MHITIIRHTTVNVPPGMIYGHTDVPLSALFNNEAEKIMTQIKKCTFDVVYSSPLSRCMRLAQKISSKVIPDSRLMELNFGNWEGKYWNDIDQTPEATAWFADFVNTPTPGGESYAQMIQRCKAFLKEIMESNFKDVCIVSHGGPMRAIKSIIENKTPQEAFDINVGYGEILKLNTPPTLLMF
ncbi:MAG: alpha-ribazole phosphatase [Prolixibacteraceae bacterium]|nr:alpha-ribazole phosphatase [Prolixibacteraceae bacterium]MBN2648451.1 alpha-ribazole phosphatase [Prolixibacteraceae bacterium]